MNIGHRLIKGEAGESQRKNRCKELKRFEETMFSVRSAATGGRRAGGGKTGGGLVSGRVLKNAKNVFYGPKRK